VFVPLDRLSEADASRAGGKASNCARLKQSGFPVPDGLVVLSTATDASLVDVARHRWFADVPSDELFAVRSSGIDEDSAGESFAGIHETLLNVTREGLAHEIRTCRESARSAQAREYRRAKGRPDTGQMGVLVQRMVKATVAGVAFTVNPVTGATDEVVINASWGLGEAIVSGRVDPDEFVVAKSTSDIRWRRIGEKGLDHATGAALTDPQVHELTTLVLQVALHYGVPQDIEWCYDGAGFWIVQSRPVTTTVAPIDEIEWTRANLAEVLPDLTSPQALAAFETLLERAERRSLGSLAAPHAQLGPFVKTFYGRMYFNLSQLRHVCRITGAAPATMLKSMGHAGAIHPGDEIAPPLSLRTLRALPDLVRVVWRHMRAARVFARHEGRTRQYLDRLHRIDPRALSDGVLWSEIDRWASSGPEFMQTVLLFGGVIFHEGPVWKACAKVGFPFERLVFPQLAVGERSVSAQQAFDLVALARTAQREPAAADYLLGDADPGDVVQLRRTLAGTAFLREFEAFIDAYGHRGRYESDWALPRYREDPSALLQSIRMHLQQGTIEDPNREAARKDREAEEAWTAFEARLSPWQKRTLLPRVRRSVAMVKRYYVWRERVRSDLVRVLSILREWHLVLADRFVERDWLDARDDYFMLYLDEVASTIRGDRAPQTLRSIVALRVAERTRVAGLQMPLLMHASQLPSLIRTAGVSDMTTNDDELRGQPVSGGCVEAEVVVVRDPADFRHMRPGAILVAPATDPSWTPLFTLAAGVIVEVGGVLSHASTIAREYGLPAIANVRQATRRLRTGDRVRLDANLGVVTKLEAACGDCGGNGLNTE
jgi:pyruvate,water dikinase